MKPQMREEFDRLLEREIDRLPQSLRSLLEEVPLIVEDYPSPQMMEELKLEHLDELCGLHDGIPLTERSVTDPALMPETLMMFREGILSMACNEHGKVHTDALVQQIRITLLHEIGHHFGLDESDLSALGYG